MNSCIVVCFFFRSFSCDFFLNQIMELSVDDHTVIDGRMWLVFSSDLILTLFDDSQFAWDEFR